jgi:hypothetical protein
MRVVGWFILPCLLGFMFIVNCGTISNGTTENNIQPQAAEHMNSEITTKDYSKLLARTQAAGIVRIIVKLNMHFVPDGQLSSQEAVEQQARIAKMQDRLCAELSKYNVKGIKKFKYTPYIAMEVDSTALAALISNSLVVSVEEDSPVPPTLH